MRSAISHPPPAPLAPPTHPVAEPAGPGTDPALADAVERALRHPQDKIALILHLSRLAPPAPRAHHIRVARVLMQDCAQRVGGQIFAMQNRDLVLLCTALPENQADAAAPHHLKATLARLFIADVPDPQRLTSFWRLDEAPDQLRAYVAASAANLAPAKSHVRALAEEMPASALSLAALEEIAAHAPLAELMIQQTGMWLGPDRKSPLADRLKPAFRQLAVSLTPLNLRPVVTEAMADPYLLHHCAARLDARLVQVLHDDLRAEGRLTRVAVKGGLPIHVCLSLEAILTPGFARMSRLARAAGVRLGIEVSLMQSCVEIELLDHVRSLLEFLGFSLILGPLDAALLSLTLPAPLNPDEVKIVWSANLAEAAANPKSRLSDTLARLGPAKFVLQGVDSEHAVAWGQSRGITRFQGPFLDQVQGATRMAACPAASACTLRQCVSRAAAQGIAGRTGCTNPALLDSSIMPPT